MSLPKRISDAPAGAPARRLKNIVLLSDGTGNSTVKSRGTNVFKLFEALDLHGHLADLSKAEQVAFYDDGVGTESLKLLKSLGGALGFGLRENVRQLYAALCRVYEPGDRIYLLGFSRGAYTVRFLADFIQSSGIVDRDKCADSAGFAKRVKESYRHYRSKYRRFKRTEPEKDQKARAKFMKEYSVVDEEHAPEGRVPIEFMGVWDTVDAYGFPFDGIAGFWDRVVAPYRFPDQFLGAQVRRACHAVSIDDERKTFHPTLWEEVREEDRQKRDDRVEQVWFAGVHSNVGGGYPKQGMSLASLDWMMDRAERARLRFRQGARDEIAACHNSCDKLYDSRAGLAVYYRYMPRDIARLCRESHAECRIHVTALDRIAHAPDGYAPGNLPADFQIVPTRDTADPSRFDGVRSVVSRALGGGSPSAAEAPLLRRVKGAIQVRRHCHTALALATLVSLPWLVKIPMIRSLAGFGTKEGQAWTIGRESLTPLGLLVGVLLVLFLVASRQRARMRRVFSHAWMKVVDDLRSALDRAQRP